MLKALRIESWAQASCKPFVLDQAKADAWSKPSSPPLDALVFTLPFRFDNKDFTWSVVFTPLGFVEKGLFPGKSAIYTMGSDYPEPFENSLKARVASPLEQSQGKPRMLLGTYELSMGQYAIIAGHGDLAAGLMAIAERSGDPDLKPVRQFLDAADPCRGKMTPQLHAALRLPMSFFQLDEYHDTVRSLNLMCAADAACGAALQKLAGRAGASAFFRLPMEHEWEYAARGGYSYLKGEVTAQDMQLALPPLPSGQGLKTYAHVDSNPPRLLPIGTKKQLHGFFDMFGNVEELVANPFTSEAGSGAVGGAQARGGNFRAAAKDIRSSKRTELTPFRKSEATGRYFYQSLPLTGVRLAIGLPLLSAFPREVLQATFAKSYVAVADEGDAAGETPQGARDLGALAAGGASLSDEVGGSDPGDVYRFSLEAYGSVVAEVRSAEKLSVALLDGAGVEVSRVTTRSSIKQQLRFTDLYPERPYLLQITPRQQVGASVTYELNLAPDAEPDSGVDKATPDTLQYAIEIGKGVNEYKGFVGASDPSDIYPVRMQSSDGGIKVELAHFNAALRIIYRDDAGKLLAEERAAPVGGGSRSISFAAAQGAARFIEILPEQPSSRTAYALQLRSAIVHDPVFGRSKEDAGQAKPAVEYSGTLGGDVSALYVAFALSRPSEVQAVLSKLRAEADLTILDANGIELSNQRTRPGPRDKIFKRIIPAGKYFARITMKGSAAAGTPFRFAFRAETKSSQDLDQKDLALSEAKAIEPADGGSAIVVPANRNARYFLYTVKTPGDQLVRLEFSPENRLALQVEDDGGRTIGTVFSADSFSVAQFSGNQGATYRIYINRQGLKGGEAKAQLAVQPFTMRGFAASAVGYEQVAAGTVGKWLIYAGKDECGVTTPDESSPSGSGPALYIQLIRFSDRFRHGILRSGPTPSTYEVFTVSKGKEQKLSLRKDPGRLAFLLRDCETGNGSCFNSDAARQIVRSQRLKFVAGSRTMVFSMESFKAALKEVSRICNVSTTFLTK